MAKKIIGFIFLAIAAAGLVYGILGLTTTKVAIKTETMDAVVDLSERTTEIKSAVATWSSGGGFGLKEDPFELAEAARSRQIWIGFGTFAVGGLAALILLKKSTGSLIHS